MQDAISNILMIKISDISIKATTTEKMGFIGREEGLAAYATILLENIN